MITPAAARLSFHNEKPIPENALLFSLAGTQKSMTGRSLLAGGRSPLVHPSAPPLSSAGSRVTAHGMDFPSDPILPPPLVHIQPVGGARTTKRDQSRSSEERALAVLCTWSEGRLFSPSAGSSRLQGRRGEMNIDRSPLEV